MRSAWELQDLDGAVGAQAEGQAVQHHAAPAVLGWDGQPGDQDVGGATACQADLWRPQWNWVGGKQAVQRQGILRNPYYGSRCTWLSQRRSRNRVLQNESTIMSRQGCGIKESMVLTNV